MPSSSIRRAWSSHAGPARTDSLITPNLSLLVICHPLVNGPDPAGRTAPRESPADQVDAGAGRNVRSGPLLVRRPPRAGHLG